MIFAESKLSLAIGAIRSTSVVVFQSAYGRFVFQYFFYGIRGGCCLSNSHGKSVNSAGLSFKNLCYNNYFGWGLLRAVLECKTIDVLMLVYLNSS